MNVKKLVASFCVGLSIFSFSCMTEATVYKAHTQLEFIGEKDPVPTFGGNPPTLVYGYADGYQLGYYPAYTKVNGNEITTVIIKLAARLTDPSSRAYISINTSTGDVHFIKTQYSRSGYNRQWFNMDNLKDFNYLTTKSKYKGDLMQIEAKEYLNYQNYDYIMTSVFEHKLIPNIVSKDIKMKKFYGTNKRIY